MTEGPSKEDIERWKNGSYTRQKLEEFDRFKSNVCKTFIILFIILSALIFIAVILLSNDINKINEQIKTETNEVDKKNTKEKEVIKEDEKNIIDTHVEYVVYNKCTLNDHTIDDGTVNHNEKYYIDLQRIRNQNYEYLDGYISKKAYNKIKKHYVVYADVKWTPASLRNNTAIPSIYKLYTLEGELIYTEGDEDK